MIKDLVEKHKLIRRLTLLWAVILITAVVIRVFWFPIDIPSGTAAALSTVVGILTVVIGLYKYMRGREDAKTNKPG